MKVESSVGVLGQSVGPECWATLEMAAEEMAGRFATQISAFDLGKNRFSKMLNESNAGTGGTGWAGFVRVRRAIVFGGCLCAIGTGGTRFERLVFLLMSLPKRFVTNITASRVRCGFKNCKPKCAGTGGTRMK